MIEREQFVKSIKDGKVPAYKCSRCGNLQLASTVFCSKCSSKNLEMAEVGGEGRIVTYTIQNVAPEEYQKYAPYAWAVVKLDAGFNISGLLPGVQSPADLPLNTKVKVMGYDERGLILARDQ